MQAIDDFRICLDLSDRERLHDYATGRTLVRPGRGGWDPQMFQGLGLKDNIPAGEWKKRRAMLATLDILILHKGLLEKKLKTKKRSATSKGLEQQGSDTEDHFQAAKEDEDLIFSGFDEPREESRDLPARVLPFYVPGEPIRGKVILKLKKTVHAEKICIKFSGQCATAIEQHENQWTAESYSYYDDLIREYFVSKESILWQKSGSGGEMGDASSEFTSLSDKSDLVKSESYTEMGRVLPAGCHEFPFEISIPQDVAQSMPPVINKYTLVVNFVRPIYRLKATLDVGRTLGRGNIVTHKGIWVEKSLDISSDRAMLTPVEVSETLETGVAPFTSKGRIVARALLPRSAFVKGEAIPLSLNIDNQSGGEITRVKARLYLYGFTVSPKGKVSSDPAVFMKSRKEASVRPIADGTSCTFDWTLLWDFTNPDRNSVDTALLPVGIMNNSKNWHLKYMAVVMVKRKGLRTNLRMSLPITIGTRKTPHDASDQID